MSKLLALHAVDWLGKHRRMDLSLDGNVSFNGGNGAGKTTLLRTLPIFFGSAPAEIVRRQGEVLESFGGHYLPLPTCYLVYEYLRGNKTQCVVIFRRFEDSTLKFQFIDAPFNATWFTKDHSGSKQILQNNEWRHHMKQNFSDVFLSSPLGVDEYRAVIQSGLHMRSGATAEMRKRINEYRQRFSFVNSGKKMEGIHRVISAVLNNQPSISDIKGILARILKQDSELDDDHKLDVKVGEIQRFVARRTALHKIKQSKDKVMALMTQSEDHHQIRTSRMKLKAQVAYTHDEHRVQSAMAEQCIQNERSKKAELEDARKKLIRNKKEELDPISEQISLSQQDLANLETRKKSYDNQGISDLSRLSEQLPDLELRSHQASKNYADASAETLSIAALFQQRDNLLQDEVRTITHQMDKITSDLKADYAAILDERKEVIRAEFDERLDRLDHRVSEGRQNALQFERKINAVQSEINNPTIDEGYGEKLNAVESECREWESDIKSHQDDLMRKMKEKEQLQQGVHSAEEERASIDQRLKLAKRALESLQEQLNPRNGTLLHFLRNNLPEWEFNVGRLIDPSLLDSRSLKPEVTNNSDSFYGLKLDVQSIDVPRFTDIEQLKISVQNKMTEIDNLGKRMTVQDKKLLMAVTAANEISKDILRAESARRSLEEGLDGSRKELAVVQHQKRVALEEASAQALALHQELMSQLGKANEHIAELLEDRNVERNSQKEQLGNIQKQTLIELNQKIENEKAHGNSELTRLDKAITKNQEDKIIALKDKGFDTNTLLAMEKDVRIINNSLALARQAHVTVQNYQEFMTNEYCRHTEIEQKLTELNTLFSEITRTYDQQLSENDNKLENCDQTLSELEMAQENRRRELSVLSEVLSGLVEFEGFIPQGDVRIKDAQVYRDEARALKQRFLENDKEGRNTYRAVRKAFTAYPGSHPYNSWQMFSVTNKWDDREEHEIWFSVADPLSKYYQTEFEQAMTSLRTEAQNQGLIIKQFYERLYLWNKDINRLGRRLTNEAVKIIEDFDSLSHFDVRVESNIQKLDYWTALQKFKELHDQWFNSNSVEAPSEAYIEQMKSVVEMIDRTGMNVSISESFSVHIGIDDGKKTGIKYANTDSDLKHISSTGLSYIALVIVYTALLNELRTCENATIMLVMDELKTLGNENVLKLLTLFNRNNIRLMTAFPDPDPELMIYFEHKYHSAKQGTEVSRMMPSQNLKDSESILFGDELAVKA